MCRSFIIALALALIGTLQFTADTAHAHTCPSAAGVSGANANPNSFGAVYSYTYPNPVVEQCSTASTTMANHHSTSVLNSLAGHLYDFILVLSDGAPASTLSDFAAGAHVRLGAPLGNTALPVLSASCPGGTLTINPNSDAPNLVTFDLEDGKSCQMTVVSSNGTYTVAFTGSTLTRTGDLYTATQGTLTGGGFGGPVPPAPTIDTVSPATGPSAGGTIVSIAGTNLLNASSVTFGGVPGTSPTVSGGGTSITVTTPAGPAGAVDVVVTTPGGAVTKVGGFSYSAGPDEDEVRARTQRVIGNFLARRADQITANDPNLVQRLTDSNGGGGSDAPVAFSSRNGLDNFNLAFSATGRDIGSADAGRGAARALTLAALGLVGEAGGDAANAATQAALGPLMAYGNDGAAGRAEDGQGLAAGSGGGGSDLMVGSQDYAAQVAPGSRFDIWADGHWAHADDETRESDFALLNLGADYRVNESLLVGVLAQIDWMDEEDTTEGTAVDGVGWMVGPYVVARLHQNLIFDGRVAGGQSDNHADLGVSSGDFDTERWLAKGQLTGDFRVDNWRFSPHVAAIYFEENQKAFTDSLDVLIPSQTVSLGRVTFGPEFSYVHHSDGIEVEPHFALKGIWDFDKAEIVDLTSGLAAGSTADIRARVESGISFRAENGASLTGEAFYDGIGVDDLDMYGGSVKATVPLN